MRVMYVSTPFLAHSSIHSFIDRPPLPAVGPVQLAPCQDFLVFLGRFRPGQVHLHVSDLDLLKLLSVLSIGVQREAEAMHYSLGKEGVVGK